MRRIHRVTVATCIGFGIALAGGLPDATAAPDPMAKPPGERVRELQRERVKALEKQLDGLFHVMAERKDPPTTYLEAIRELGEAELDLATGRTAELKALERTVRRFKEAEEMIEALWATGLQNKQSVAQTKAARLKAEIRLETRKAVR